MSYAGIYDIILKQRNCHTRGKNVDAVCVLVLYPCDERTSFDSFDIYWVILQR